MDIGNKSFDDLNLPVSDSNYFCSSYVYCRLWGSEELCSLFCGVAICVDHYELQMSVQQMIIYLSGLLGLYRGFWKIKGSQYNDVIHVFYQFHLINTIPCSHIHLLWSDPSALIWSWASKLAPLHICTGRLPLVYPNCPVL